MLLIGLKSNYIKYCANVDLLKLRDKADCYEK